MKVTVVGSSTFEDYKLLKSTLDSIEISEVIVSTNTRANILAQWYAVEQNIPYQVHTTKDSAKNVISSLNRDLIDACDMVVAFWDGKSRETLKAIDYAKSQNKVVEVKNFR
jgi:hypothetical protein